MCNIAVYKCTCSIKNNVGLTDGDNLKTYIYRNHNNQNVFKWKTVILVCILKKRKEKKILPISSNRAVSAIKDKSTCTCTWKMTITNCEPSQISI